MYLRFNGPKAEPKNCLAFYRLGLKQRRVAYEVLAFRTRLGVIKRENVRSSLLGVRLMKPTIVDSERQVSRKPAALFLRAE